jgi:DNA-binding transcriptional MocR family regulator
LHGSTASVHFAAYCIDLYCLIDQHSTLNLMTRNPVFRRDALATLAEQLAEHYAQRIQQEPWAAGTRLPSVRSGAERHGLAPSTVVAAYDQLQARGLIEARAQRGFFVRSHQAGGAPRALRPAAPDVAPLPPADVTSLVRSMFAQRAYKGTSPGMGTMPPEWLDLPLLHTAMRRALADDVRDAASLRYGEPAGDIRLREALSQRLAQWGVSAAPAQIVTTGGATAALELVTQLLLRAGDAVLVDEPGWPVEFARLTQMGLHLLPVPRRHDGPDRAVLLAHLQGPRKPRVYVTVSVMHNPTGSTLTLAAAHEVLKLAEAHALTIVEDDTYGWLAPPQAPRLAALDQLQRTVYVSGFSKVLTPSWRVGFLAASPALVEQLVNRKLLTTLATPTLTERALAITLEQGGLRRHADGLANQLAAARTRTTRLALDAGFEWAVPPQGLFGWLNTGVDTDRLAEALHHQGWLLAPGSLFHVRPQASPLMRINFATAQDARFWRALRAHCGRLAALAP